MFTSLLFLLLPPLITSAPTGAASDRGQLLVFDDTTFDLMASHALGAQELPCSLTSVTFSGDDTPYYALGTAFVKPEEYEPSKGRLLLFAYRWGLLQGVMRWLYHELSFSLCLL